MSEDDWPLRDPGSIVDRETGKPRLHSEKCATCVFWPDNRMFLAPGRLKELIEENLRLTSWISCHERLPQGHDGQHGEAVCRGFYDAAKGRSGAIQIVERLGGFTEVPIPPDPRE